LWIGSSSDSYPNGEAGGIFGYSNTYGGYAGGQAEYLRVPYANVGPRVVPGELEDEQVLFLTDVLPTSYWGVETINFEDYDNTGEYIKEITHGGADVVLDCVGMDGKMSAIEKIETMLKLQGGSKSAIEIASQAVRKCGTVVLVGVYGARYNMFPLGDFFSRNITLKMGQCPAQRYVDPILKLIKDGKFDATDIITHKLKLDEGKHAYTIFDNKLEDCIKVILKPEYKNNFVAYCDKVIFILFFIQKLLLMVKLY